jgi:uncharacterized surface protein with fasciclin (FAS1) repeats
MRSTLTRTRGLAAALIGSLALVTACSTSAADETSGGSSDMGAPAASPSATAAAEGPFGPGCSGLPASGPGSVTGMAAEPVATAASNNPALSTLVTAVTKAGLVDTLNKAPSLTVFAPTNEAFAKIPKDTLNKVLADKAALTKILTYHVVGTREAPAELDGGSLATLQGGKLTTSKTGENYSVNDAKVVCGNIQTRNATVYLIDSVLMPAA